MPNKAPVTLFCLDKMDISAMAFSQSALGAGIQDFFKRLKRFLLEANKKIIAALWQRPGQREV